MTIVAGSLIFRPNRCVRIGRSCGRVLARPGQLRPLRPRTCGLPVEPQEQVSGFKEGRSVLEPSFTLGGSSSIAKRMASAALANRPYPRGEARLCLLLEGTDLISLLVGNSSATML